MQKLARFAIAASAVIAAAAATYAEQEVKLKSGATLVGDVTFEGDALLVDVDGARERLQLADVESITPTGFGPRREAARLLLAALESRQLGGTPREALGLLTEAARLDPDNSQVAFWRASMLVDAGQGKAAQQTFESNRDAITAAYPDAVTGLAERIRMRSLIEMLPPHMVERIDQFNAAAASQPANAPIRPMAVAFRVLDQFNDPVPPSVFQVQASGSDPVLEPYPDGYYLYLYNRRRDEAENPLHIAINQYGFKPQQHELRASSAAVAIAGSFVAHRFVESEKREKRFIVVDREGAPLAGALVALRSNLPGEAGAQPESLTATTSDAGEALLSAYPGPYAFSVSRESMHDAAGSLQVGETEADNPVQRLTLYPMIRARMLVAWISTPVQPGGMPTPAGVAEAEVLLGESGPPASAGAPLRLVQEGESLRLQLESFPYYAPGAPGFVAPWLKKQAGERDGDAATRLKAVDLQATGGLSPPDFEPVAMQAPAPGYGQPMPPIVAQAGDLFVGQFVGRDPRNGQMVNVTFKAVVVVDNDDRQ